jgi:hypothetical protein
MARRKGLTPRQHRAISALIAAKSHVEAAEVAGVGERTLYRWLADPAFRAELSQAEGELIDLATRRLIDLQEAAIDALDETLDAGAASPGVRLRAASLVLDYLLKLRELRTLEKRLSDLEEATYGNKELGK